MSPKFTAAGASLMAALCLTPAAALAASAPAVPSFYQTVMSMKPTGKLGQVIGRERIATQIKGAEAWRIAYVSSDLRGVKTLSTALVIVPRGKPPAEGRPIVAWAHGTTGTAQNCGPSQVNDPAQELNEYFLLGGTSWTDFGVPGISHFIDKGYAVVATDYQGLGGGGGAHQYAIAVSNGQDAINSVRALGSMGLAGAGKKAIIYGWSQGGGATLAAASLKDYAAATGTAYDGVSFAGFVAMAPDDINVLIPPDAANADVAPRVIQQLDTAFSDNVFNFAHFSMSMWAMPQAFPDLKLTDIFTEAGAKALDDIYRNKCMHAGADTISFNFGDSYKSLVKPQADNAVAWVKGLQQASVPPVAPAAPVIVYFGDKDTTVNPVMGALYQKQMCGMGANIARQQLPGEQNHFTTPPIAQPLFTQWIDDRFAGKPAANGCPTN